MMLSRLAGILIHVGAPQSAAAQPEATARHGKRRPWRELDTGTRTGQLGNARKVDSGVVRVLVAEDDEALGDVLARGLREQG